MSVRLRQLSDGDWDAYQQIYTASFPESERKSFSFMTEGEKADAYDLLVIETDTHPVAGMVITVHSGAYCMLDYFAVSTECRGQGIGHAVLPLIRTFCTEKYPEAHFFLEIEVPVEDCDNPEQRKKRKAFYLSAGLVETSVRAFIYGSDMELLAYPEDAPYIRFAAYQALLSETFPAGMLPDER